MGAGSDHAAGKCSDGGKTALQVFRRRSEGLQGETEKGEVFQAEGGIGQILKVSEIESLVCPVVSIGGGESQGMGGGHI